MSFLLDSDTSSAYMKGDGRVVNRVIQHGGRLFVSTITVGELATWALRAKASPRRMPDLLAFLRIVDILDVDEVVARKFGEIRAGLLDAGRRAPEMDLLIAATALVHGLTLVTHNTRDYARVPGLALADWLAP